MRWSPPAVVVLALALPATALAHAERASYFPDPTKGSVPVYRTTGPSHVVCKPDSRERIERDVADPAAREKNLELLGSCRFEHIQGAVDAASNYDRILILPGVYKEEPSLADPEPDPRCEDMYEEAEGTQVPSYEYQRSCPNAQNLIAVVGDDEDEDRECDDKCHLQIEGTGDGPDDVLISGSQTKLNVIRADRADGIYLRNFTIELSDFNNIYGLETNGFRFDTIVSRYSREYGFLTFVSDNGIYENLEAYGAGDGGIYPGSGPEGKCERYGIEIRNVDSHDNAMGYSGTAGNGVWVHDSRFHHNATGLVTDSFASGHPGSPQDCAKWERNQFYSNNLDVFNDERDEYCQKPYAERDPRIVCPTFPLPVGTGLMIAGGNSNIVRENLFYDNWRTGVRLFWVPAAVRDEPEPEKQYDTSHSNSFVDNLMGMRPDGTADPNGQDFWWDEEGSGNCWSGNTGPGGAKPRSDPATLPGCPGGSLFSPGNPVKQAEQASCAAWNPEDNTDPPGCDWMVMPRDPGGGGEPPRGGGGGQEAPTPAPARRETGDDPALRARLSRRPLRLSRRGVVRVRVACPASALTGCVAMLRLETARPVSSRPGRSARRRIKLGSAPFAIGAGRSTAVPVRVPTSRVRTLRRLGTVRVRAAILVRGRRAVESTFTLRATR